MGMDVGAIKALSVVAMDGLEVGASDGRWA